MKLSIELDREDDGRWIAEALQRSGGHRTVAGWRQESFEDLHFSL